MAQIKNSRKSEGLCEKLHNAVSPFRSRNRRISHQETRESGQLLLVPVEFNHSSARNTKKLVAPSPAIQSSAGKENRVNRVQEFDDKEVPIIRGQKFAKLSAPPEKGDKIAPTARFTKVGSYKDDESIHEGRFSEYISKVRNRMMKTASNVGGGVERNISFE